MIFLVLSVSTFLRAMFDDSTAVSLENACPSPKPRPPGKSLICRL
jgi:hypothetical protein